MSKVRSLLNWTVLAGLLVALGWVVLNQQPLLDRWVVSRYQASPAIAELADNSGMSDKGRFYFYLADPVLESPEKFNSDCQRLEQGNPVLGCYRPDINQIFIYDVKNPELDGSKEVTSAHEMLHVAYSRLSKTEKNDLEVLLEQAYSKNKTPELEQRMDYYNTYQPGSRSNELHSILGTEFVDLGDELEKYYGQYFVNRQAVVDNHNKYSQKFKNITNELDSLSQELASLKIEIDNLSSRYTSEVTRFNQLANAFNQKANSGEFSSRQEFNSERGSLMVEQQALEQLRQELMDKIGVYNQKADRMNELGWHLDKLNNSLDSLKAVD